jgi:hypothetical protein
VFGKGPLTLRRVRLEGHAPRPGGAGGHGRPGRIVKLTVTRQQMFAFTVYRTPASQWLRLDADSGGCLHWRPDPAPAP